MLQRVSAGATYVPCWFKHPRSSKILFCCFSIVFKWLLGIWSKYFKLQPSVKWRGAGWTNWSSKLGRVRRLILLLNIQKGSMDNTFSYSVGAGVYSRLSSGWVLPLATNHQIVSRLRIFGTLVFFVLYSCMAWNKGHLLLRIKPSHQITYKQDHRYVYIC
jgi:hypothetical protein